MSTVTRKPMSSRVRPGRSPDSAEAVVLAGQQSTGLNVEMAAYGAIVLLAAVIRLGGLDLLPLAPEESANAWQSWSLLQWGTGDIQAGPLYAYGTALLMALFGGSDVVPRALPALAGTALVALPYLIRRQLGREEALLGALFLAISPSLVFYSRYAGPEMLAALLSLLTLVLVAEYLLRPRKTCAIGAGIGLALLLTAGSLAWLSLTVAGLALIGWVVLQWRARRAVPGKSGRSALLSQPTLTDAKDALIVAAITLVVVSTGLGSDLSGLQRGPIDSLGAWLSVLFTAPSLPWHQYLLTLGIYEAGLALLASAWVVLTRAEPDKPFGKVLVAWAGLAILVASIGGHREPGLVTQMAAPLALLAAFPVAAALRRLAQPGLGWSIIAFALTVVPLVFLLYIVMNHFSLPNPKVDQLALVAPVLALGLVLSAWASHLGWRRCACLVTMLFAGLTLLYSIGTSINLCFAGFDRPAPLLSVSTSSTDARSLARQIEDLSSNAAMRGESPVVRLHPDFVWPTIWYTKRVAEVKVGSSGNDHLVVANAEDEVPEGYVAQRYRLYYAWEPSIVDWRDVWRWAMLHEPPESTNVQDVKLFVRTYATR